MIEYRTLRTANQTVANRPSNLIVAARGPFPMDDFEVLEGLAYHQRGPRVMTVSGSAVYGAKPATMDLTDHAEIKAPSATVRKTSPFLHSVVGPMLTFAAAALVAIMISLTPASDRSILPDGPLAGHGLLHFPR